MLSEVQMQEAVAMYVKKKVRRAGCPDTAFASFVRTAPCLLTSSSIPQHHHCGMYMVCQHHLMVQTDTNPLFSLF